MSVKTELYWAAGFFDGEGTAGFYAGSQLHLRVGQSTKEPLERFQKAVGGGHVTGPQKPHGRGKLPVYVWQIFARTEAIRIAKLLIPLVCNKREQIQKALDAALAYEPRQGSNMKVCRKGHSFTSDNIYTDKRGFRGCIECQRVRNREWMRKHKDTINAKRRAKYASRKLGVAIECKE